MTICDGNLWNQPLLFFLCDWFAAIIKVNVLLRHFYVIMVLLNVCDALLLKNTESFGCNIRFSNSW